MKDGLPTSEFAMTGMPSDVEDGDSLGSEREAWIAERVAKYLACDPKDEHTAEFSVRVFEEGYDHTFLQGLNLAYQMHELKKTSAQELANALLQCVAQFRNQTIELAQKCAGEDYDV